MTPEALAESEVDVCSSCGGMWIDWFDGEIKRVATELLKTEEQRLSRPSAPVSSMRNEPIATGACPRCTRQLVAERYVVQAEVGRGKPGERASVAQATGASLLRCEECMGAFVPRTSATLLATLPADDVPPPSSTEGAKPLEPLPWQKFMGVVRKLLG